MKRCFKNTKFLLFIIISSSIFLFNQLFSNISHSKIFKSLDAFDNILNVLSNITSIIL